MKKRIVVWGIVAALALAGIGSYLIFRAKNNLVTLDVRDMDIRQVASKLEWQTREKIIVHKDVQGKVTFNVTRVPLDEVLNIISEQLSTRWTALYPLYTSSDSIESFKKVARGDLPPDSGAWTNLQSRGFGFGGRGPGGPGGFGNFGDAAAAQTKVINLELINRDLPFAVMALSRGGQSQVVPENGTAGNITVKLESVPYPKAVAAVAEKVNRKWDQYYLLRPGFDFGRGRDGDMARDGGDRRRNRDGETNRFDPQAMEARRDEFASQRERQFEAQLATMTPEQQQKAKEERQQFEDLRNMTPEEREKRFQEIMARPEVQQRMEQRTYRGVMNTTPEQRVERARQRLERQKRWQQRQQQNSN